MFPRHVTIEAPLVCGIPSETGSPSCSGIPSALQMVISDIALFIWMFSPSSDPSEYLVTIIVEHLLFILTTSKASRLVIKISNTFTHRIVFVVISRPDIALARQPLFGDKFPLAAANWLSHFHGSR